MKWSDFLIVSALGALIFVITQRAYEKFFGCGCK